MRPLFFIIATFLISGYAYSADANQATLDTILAEIRALNEKVSSLESRLAQYEENAEVAAEVSPAAAAYAAKNPPPKGSKDKWYESLRIELRKADVRASGAWTIPETWARVALKMSPEEAVAILGEPMLKKFSLRNTDEIFIYQGDLDGTGNPIKGEIRIRHNRFAKIVVPNF
jgi:outer membrane murein-binding lipoprotein Lpp